MALVMGEGAAGEVENLIHSSARSRSELWMTTVNLGEVWYSVARKKSPAAADDALELVALAGIRIAAADWALTYQAAQYKSRYRISYADAFAAALAHGRGIELVTGDPEFKAIESEIKIHWLAPKAGKKSKPG
jgi:predicted nucleic acid-binding protein